MARYKGKLYAGLDEHGETVSFPVCQECVDDNMDDEAASYREIVCTVHNRDETCMFCERVVVPMPDGGPRGNIHDGFGNRFDFADEM